MNSLIQFDFNILLLILSPLMGALGAMVRALILEGEMKEYNQKGKTFSESFTYKDFQWFSYHLFIGTVTGLATALLFIGGLKEEISSLGRVLVIAMFAGYSGITVWTKQEKIIESIIEKKIKEIANTEKE